jgi:heme/copper-type cytochrome/quinol oxidase subunit 4
VSEKAIRRRLVFGFHTSVSILLFYFLLQIWEMPVYFYSLKGLSPTLYYILLVAISLFVVIQFTVSLMIFLKREREDRENRKRKDTDVESEVIDLTLPNYSDYQIGDDL